MKTSSSLNAPAQELLSSVLQHPSSLTIPLFFSDPSPSSPHQPLLGFACPTISPAVGGEFTLPHQQPLHNGSRDRRQLLSTHGLSRRSKTTRLPLPPGPRAASHIWRAGSGRARGAKEQLAGGTSSSPRSAGVGTSTLLPARCPGWLRRQRWATERTFEGSHDTANPKSV